MGITRKIRIKIRRYSKKNRVAISRIVATCVLIVAIVGGIIVTQRETMAIEYNMEGVSIQWLPEGVSKRKVEIDNQASRYDIDANFVAIIMTLESGGYDKADSGQAEGLMQVTPETAKDISSKHLIQPVDSYNLFDPETSIEFGVSYLAYLRNTFCGVSGEVSVDKCIEMIAAGYNGGPGAANSVYKDIPLQQDETAIYSNNAVKMWNERLHAKSGTYDRWLAAGGQSLVDKALES